MSIEEDNLNKYIRGKFADISTFPQRMCKMDDFEEYKPMFERMRSLYDNGELKVGDRLIYCKYIFSDMFFLTDKDVIAYSKHVYRSDKNNERYIYAIYENGKHGCSKLPSFAGRGTGVYILEHKVG